MSWLGRLFGAKAEPAPPVNSVIVDAELARQLTTGGLTLDVAVDAAVRAYLEAQAKAAEAGEPERVPFWLRRDDARSADIEDELRDRVIQRQASSDDDANITGSPQRRSGKQMELGEG